MGVNSGKNILPDNYADLQKAFAATAISPLSVTKVEHVGEHRLQLTFSDGTSQVVDFGPFLENHPHPQHNKYRRLVNFKRFRIERGNVVWGRDWDLIFPLSQLHQGYVGPAVY